MINLLLIYRLCASPASACKRIFMSDFQHEAVKLKYSPASRSCQSVDRCSTPAEPSLLQGPFDMPLESLRSQAKAVLRAPCAVPTIY